MDYLIAIVLGIVQGATEFLPISSSAHLRFVPQLLGSSDPGASFTAIIQLGTIVAVLLFFYKDLTKILLAGWKSLRGLAPWSEPDSKMFLGIALGTLPIIFLGLILQDVIRTAFRNLYLIALLLIFFGILIWLIDKFQPKIKKGHDLKYSQMLLIGFAQALALVPGVSRSGATIAAARLFKLERKEAARFSFLLSVPAIIASGLYESLNISSNNPAGWGPTLVAAGVSFLVGYASIAWLLKWLASNSLGIFAIYRAIVGVALLIALSAGFLNPF
ncbi:MAG: undecaprenyl-diphosphatase UppP [Candidatus Nanopelagicales bacterium]